MIVLSTVPLDHLDVKNINDIVFKRHDLLDEIKELGDYSILEDNYKNPIETPRFHIDIQEVWIDSNYLVYVNPTRKLSRSAEYNEYNEYEYQYSYEFNYELPNDHVRMIDNPLRYWYYLTRYNPNTKWTYEPLDEFWMKDTSIELDKVEGLPDIIRKSLELDHDR